MDYRKSVELKPSGYPMHCIWVNESEVFEKSSLLNGFYITFKPEIVEWIETNNIPLDDSSQFMWRHHPKDHTVLFLFKNDQFAMHFKLRWGGMV